MISTQGIQSTTPSGNNFTPSYINIGVQYLKINSIEAEVASTGSTRMVFNVETEPVADENFKHFDGNAGQTGKISTFYLKTESQQREFFANLLLIADKLGVKAEIEAVNEKNLGSFESYAAAITPIFNKAGYAWFRIAGDEYEKNNGKIGVSLRFSRFGFVASTAEGESHLKPIDPNNTYDLKKLEVIKDESPIVNSENLPYSGNMY